MKTTQTVNHPSLRIAFPSKKRHSSALVSSQMSMLPISRYFGEGEPPPPPLHMLASRLHVVGAEEAVQPAPPPFILSTGLVQPGCLDDVVTATFDLCRSLGKIRRIRKRDKSRVQIVCATATSESVGKTDACPFSVSAP
jgi:hypothetical protein